MNVGERIREIRELRNLTLKEVAESLGKTEATVQRYESGNINIKNDTLAEIANILDVSPAYLMGWIKDNSNIGNSNYNYFDTAVSAGEVTALEAIRSDDVKKISLPADMMGKYAGNKDLFVTRTNGDSMNKVFPDESLIVVKYIASAFDLADNDIVVFRYNDGIAVKRFFNDTQNNRLIFKPDSYNVTFTDLIVDYEDVENLQIYGKVVAYTVHL